MRNDNAESGPRTGLLMALLLSQERELAQSLAGQRMREAVQSQLQLTQAGTSPQARRSDLQVLAQRAAALQLLPPATSLSSQDPSALGMTGLPPAEGEALLQSLVRGGLAGVGEVQGVLATAGQTLARVTQDRGRIDAADQQYDKSVGTDQGQVLAAGLLRHLTGDAQLQVSAGATPDQRVRAALTGPAGTLAALGASADAQSPLRQRLQALADRHGALALTERKAQAELVIESFAAFDSLAAFHSPADAQARAAARQPLLDRIEQCHQDMQAVVAERRALLGSRRALLGSRRADALQGAVRAAALATHPDRLDFTPLDGLAGKVRKTFDGVGPALKAGLLAQDPARLHAERLRVNRSCPLITPKDARSSLQMLAIARAMAALCA